MSSKIDIARLDPKIIVNTNIPLVGGASAAYPPLPPSVPTPPPPPLPGFYGIEVQGYTNIVGFAYSDVGSIINGLEIQQASDLNDFVTGIGITRSTFTIVAGDSINNAFAVEIVAPFARIVYNNAGAAQSVFRLYAVAKIIRGG